MRSRSDVTVISRPPSLPRPMTANSPLGKIGEGGARRIAIDAVAQQVDADLELAVVRPAPRDVEAVAEIARPSEGALQLRRKDRLRWGRIEEIRREDAIEQQRLPRELLGKARCAAHDLGDELQQCRIGMEQREELDPG